MKSLFPIGSVVNLEGATKSILIIGTEVMKEDDDTVYDYVGVPYPEGYIGNEMLLLFMHDDIEQVHFLGFVNSDMQIYRAQETKDDED